VHHVHITLDEADNFGRHIFVNEIKHGDNKVEDGLYMARMSQYKTKIKGKEG